MAVAPFPRAQYLARLGPVGRIQERGDDVMNLFDLVPAAWQALKAGRMLNNPAAWKKVQNIVNFLAALVTVAAAFGYTIPVSSDDLTMVAGGIVALVNIYLTVATTDKIGLGKPKNNISPIELMGQTQGYNDASQNVGSPPAAEFERIGTDVAPQNSVIRQPVVGIERGNSVADGLRQSVQAVDYPIGGADDTYPNLPPAGFGDRD